MSKYLLDTNVFIQAYNQHYRMNFCPAFWDWLDLAYRERKITSIKMVYEEIQKAKDDLSKWCQNYPDLFEIIPDEPTQNYHRQAVLPTVMNNYSYGKSSQFMKGADPWLIATAKVKDLILVTQEHYKPSTRKKILIPNLCKDLGIKCIDPFTMISEIGARFVLE